MLDIVIIVAMPLIAIIAMILTFKIESVTGSIIFFIVSIIALSILLISFQKKDRNKKFHLYELKLSDGTIVTDSLYSEKEYFYNKKGTKYYYKTYIIYSKKLN